MRQTARLITTGTFQNDTVSILGKTYPATLQARVQDLVDNEGLDLSVPKTLILVPNTLSPTDKGNYTAEQPPYLDFTVIGVPVNQYINEDDLDIVRITGKVFYENLNYNFILVKLEHGRNDQKIKLVGTLEDSLFVDADGVTRGSAKDKYFNIEAEVVGNQLKIVDSWRVIEQPILKPKSNVVSLDSYRNTRYAA